MKRMVIIVFLLCIISCLAFATKTTYQKDVIQTSAGDLEITFFGHGTLALSFNNLHIYIDPVKKYADFSKMPDADVILITHHHGDHLDKNAIKSLLKFGTKIFLTETCFSHIKKGTVIKNGEQKEIKGIQIKAVPAYNIVNKRDNGQPFHKKGEGNGYVLSFGDKTVYIAGDTENIPEMKNLKGVDIAFLPMNLPYTMTPEMVTNAVEMIKPAILYPYHYGKTDVNELLKLYEGNENIDVRIRDMQ